MTWATSNGRNPSLPHLMIESEVRKRRFSFSSNSSNSQTSPYTSSTPAKGGHPGRRSTFPHLFESPCTIKSFPHHADLSSSFTYGNNCVGPLSLQYSPEDVANDSGYYGSLESPAKNIPGTFERFNSQKTWETLASPLQKIKRRLEGRQSYLDTSPRKGFLGKVTPRRVLSSLVLVLTTIFGSFVLFHLTDVVGVEDELIELNQKVGELSLDYPDDPQFRGSYFGISKDGSIGMEPDYGYEDRKGNTNIETANLLEEYNEDQIDNFKMNIERDLSEEMISKPTVVKDGQILGDKEEIVRNNIVEDKRKKLDERERKKKMWEKNELLRAKLMEERKERRAEERKNALFEKEL